MSSTTGNVIERELYNARQRSGCPDALHQLPSR